MTTSHSPGAPAVAAAGLDVLVADKFETSGLDGLRAAGCRVRFEPEVTATTLENAVREHDPDVLVVRGTKVTAAALECANRLSLVVRAGAGYDSIDVGTASERGIFVANCPGKNAIAVAELTWGLILACDRRIPDQTADLRRGAWKKKEYSKAAGIYGRTLGIVGLGQIGCEVATRALAFGMRVVAWSRSLTEQRALDMGVGYCSNVVNLAKQSDVVTIHVAATPETQGLIGEKFLAAMKPGAFLINTSRGSVVDQACLAKALREKGLRLGLDVFGNEPAGGDGTFDDAIAKEPGVYGTHHVGASTDQAQQAIAAEVVRVVDTYQRTGSVLNCVNRATTTPATNLLTVRHHNRPGVLAHIFYTLGQAGINVEEMENIIYEGAHAACARIQLDEPPSAEQLNAIRANSEVLSVQVTTITRKR